MPSLARFLKLVVMLVVATGVTILVLAYFGEPRTRLMVEPVVLDAVAGAGGG